MQAFVGNLIHRKPRRALSPEFKHALAREVLKTERLRVIALIITATVLAAALTTADVVAPAILDRVWQGHFPILYVWAGLGGFILFEASVLALISRQLKRDLDVPR
ncbi:MAG TPA: adenylate/guanylate cyclase domain-containing protein, partial [Xanthobacteraceae bacterium]|nr:adenylate/guanylate cyclase domain-containing protein [Xanthobacteraceae bacterium]